jgi:hypothetical protein
MSEISGRMMYLCGGGWVGGMCAFARVARAWWCGAVRRGAAWCGVVRHVVRWRGASLPKRSFALCMHACAGGEWRGRAPARAGVAW